MKAHYILFLATLLVSTGIVQLSLAMEGSMPNAADTLGALLVLAIQRDDIDEIKSLIERGANVNYQTPQTAYTPLMFVATIRTTQKYNQLTMAMLLLSKGADINARDSSGNTAIRYALTKGNNILAQMLLDRGAENPNPFGHTPFINAIQEHDINAVLYFIGMGVNVNYRVAHNQLTPLMIAVQKFNDPDIDKDSNDDNSAIIELLLENGAEVDARDANQNTALIYAAADNNANAVTILLEHGADIDDQDNQGSSALINAVEAKNLGMIKILLENGADVNIQDNDGNTALMVAVGGEHVQAEIVEILLEYGADTTIQNIHGQTAYNAHNPLTLLLLDYYTPPEAMDTSGT